MGGVTSNLVAKTLGADQSNLIADALVGLEVEGELRVVTLNDDLGGLLDGLGANCSSRIRVLASETLKRGDPRFFRRSDRGTQATAELLKM